MARWAVLQSMDQLVGWKQIRIDCMVLMMNGLLAAQFAELLSLAGTKLGVAAAMFGASSTMVFSKLHATFIEKAVKTAIFIGPDERTSIPAAIPPPVEVTAVGPHTLQSVAETLIDALSHEPPAPTDEQIEAYLRRLGNRPEGEG